MTDRATNPTGVLGAWRQDLLASLVVFLVAMPLCMGIALASGAPVAAGLVTGIIGGIVVGSLAGAPLQVSGPAAGLTVVCGEIIREHGLPALGIVVILAGGLQIVAGLLKWGQWFRAVSPAVIHGMLSGIGVLILASQIHVMVDDRPRQNGLANLVSIPTAVWKGLQFGGWEPVEQRQARIGFLQQFGQLHERQREIESQVERLVSKHGSRRQHEWEASHLGDYLPLQELLIRDLRAAQQRYAKSPVATSSEVRTAAIDRAVRNAEAALVDLKSHDIVQAEASQSAATQAVGEVLSRLKSHDWAAKMGLLAIAVIVLWQGLAPKRIKLIPGPLLAVVVATSVAWLVSLPVLYVEVPDRLWDGLTLPALSVFQDVPLRELIVGGVMMAVIASAETLLCAGALDKMHQGPRAQYDRELAAQGVGNLLCGFLGALPMTGVIVRSATNVQAGAKSRLSAILHGVWLLLFVVALSFVLRMIPTCALAGILVYTGFKLIDWKGFYHLWKYSKSEAFIFLITLVVIVVEDLLVGVVTGVILSSIKLLVTFSHLDVQLLPEPTMDGRPGAKLKVAGAATFLRLPLLAAKLDEVPAGAELHVDFEHLDYIDHACLELLMGWAKQHEAAGGRLVVDWGGLHARFRQNGRRVAQKAMTTTLHVPAVEQSSPAA